MTRVALVIRTASRLLAPALLAPVLLVLATAQPVAAQVIRPPNIQKPIESARKAAGATSAGIQNAQKVADDPKAQLPAAAAQAGAKGVPSTAKGNPFAGISTLIGTEPAWPSFRIATLNMSAGDVVRP